MHFKHVGGAADPSASSIEDMSINHRRADVRVTEQLLDCPDVVAVLQQVGGKGMPKRMTRGRLEDSRLESGLFKRFLLDRLMEMMPVLLPGEPVEIEDSAGAFGLFHLLIVCSLVRALLRPSRGLRR